MVPRSRRHRRRKLMKIKVYQSQKAESLTNIVYRAALSSMYEADARPPSIYSSLPCHYYTQSIPSPRRSRFACTGASDRDREHPNAMLLLLIPRAVKKRPTKQRPIHPSIHPSFKLQREIIERPVQRQISVGYRPPGVNPTLGGTLPLTPPPPLPLIPPLPPPRPPGRLKSGFPFKMTSSRRLCTAEAEEGGAKFDPSIDPPPAGRQCGFTGLCEILVKWLASLARSLP